MHILVLPSFYATERQPLGGIFFRQQALALKRQGHQVGLIYPDIRSAWREPKHFFKALSPALVSANDEGMPVLRARGFSIPKLPHYTRQRWLKMALELFEIYKERYDLPDVIHAHSAIWAGAAAAQIKQRHQVPFVLTEHRGRFINNAFVKPRLLAETRHPLVAEALMQASAVITVASQMQPYLAALAPAARLLTIPNMVDTERFKPSPTQAERPFGFLCVALLTPVKGCDTLLRAFAAVRKQLEDVRLNIVGDGSELAHLRALAKELALGESVTFLGQLEPERVAQEMRRAHSFVMASRYEAFGVVFIEALASGLALIGTRSGGPEDIIRPENGLLVEVDNVPDLVAAMKTLYSNKEAYPSEALRSQAVERYSEAAVAKQIERVLEQSVQGQTR